MPKKTVRARGTGSVYTVPGSRNWWIKYYIGGVRKQESAKTDNKRKAEKFLQIRLNAIAGGQFSGPEIDRITIDEIMQDFLKHQRVDGMASVDDNQRRWDVFLKPAFGHYRCSQLSTTVIDEYKEKRKKTAINVTLTKKSGKIRKAIDRFPSNATVNRELAVLRAAFRYAAKVTVPPKVTKIPPIKLFREPKPRKGFLPDEKVAALRTEAAKIGLWMETILEIYLSLAWRKNEPIRNIRVHQIDLKERTIRLDDSKNGEGRPPIPMNDRLFQLVQWCVTLPVKRNKKEPGRIKEPNDLAFTKPSGRPIGDFKKTWKKITTAAGVPGLRVHDLRRTAARSMRNLGLSESVIMAIGGWETNAMFKRYSIVDPHDLKRAAELQNRQHEQEKKDIDECPTPEVGDSLAIGPSVN